MLFSAGKRSWLLFNMGSIGSYCSLLLNNCVTDWLERKEPEVFSYFKKYYANRVGNFKRLLKLVKISIIICMVSSYTQRNGHLLIGILNTEILPVYTNPPWK